MLSVLKDILVNFYQNIFWTIEALSCYINTKKQQVVLLYDHLPVTCSDIIFCISSIHQIVKETIGVGVNEKAVLRFYKTALSFTSISIFPW